MYFVFLALHLYMLIKENWNFFFNPNEQVVSMLAELNLMVGHKSGGQQAYCMYVKLLNILNIKLKPW